MLEVDIKNVTSDKEAFEHIASDLRKKLTVAETRYTTVEDQLKEQIKELQKVSYLEDKVAQLSALEIEAQNIPELRKQISILTTEKSDYEHIASELRKKLNESEQRNVLLEDTLATRNEEMPVMQTPSELEDRQSEMETRITAVTSEKDELQRTVVDLQNKLTEAELCNNSMKEKLSEHQSSEQPSELQDLQDLETQIKSLTSEKSILERTVCEIQDKLKETEETNNSITGKLNEQQEEIQRLRNQEKQIEHLTSEKHEFELTIGELQKKLSETIMSSEAMKNPQDQEDTHKVNEEVEKQIQDAIKEKNLEFEQINVELRELELTNNSLKTKLAEQELCVEKTRENLEKQIEDLTIGRNEVDIMLAELKDKLKEAELTNSSLKDKLNEYETDAAKIEDLEAANETRASETSQLELVISELQEKLKETELRNNSIEKELSLRQLETQKAIDEQRKCMESFALERSELEDTIHQLQEKSQETELRCNLMQNRINEQDLQLQKSHALENEIECLMSRTREFECTVRELRDKLAKAEQDILPESKEQRLQQIQKSEETQIEELALEKSEHRQMSEELHGQLLKSPEKNSKDDRNDDQVNRLKNHINNLQAIVEDLQKENTRLKEHALAKSMISDHEYDMSKDDSRTADDLSISRISLEEDSARLSMDLLLKNQELDEIKNDVQSLKTDIGNLQKTIYLLTTENSELASKLSAEKECAEKSAVNFQQIIDELYARNSKIIDEKLNMESNLIMLSEQMENLRSRIPETNLNEKEIILKYEEQLGALTAENTELLSNVADRMKELEMLKESKSLLYEHDCMYKDKLMTLTEKHDSLAAECNELSSDLMDKIEENDGLRQECNILQSKLELSLKSKEDIGNDDAEQLRTENTLLKTELVELRANVKALNEENSKISNQLVETIEDLDNAQKIISCNDASLHLSMLFNNTSVMNNSMTNDKFTKDNNAEAKIENLQEEVSHLTHLNRKLSDLKLSTCTQCTHLKELNESRRMLKLEVKSLSHKLEDLQRKFDCKSAKSDMLILKAKEDVNLSLCNSSLNVSFSENMNVSYIEDRLQSLSTEVQTLKEERRKLSDLYKEKCNEIEELQNNSITDTILNDDLNLSIKKSPHKTLLRLENVVKVMNELQNDFERIKQNNMSVRTDLAKFTTERDSLLIEINSLRNTNENLLQKLSENERWRTSALEKAEILENEIADLTRKLQELTVKHKEMENEKLLLEIDAENLKEDKTLKERTMNELRQSLSYLQHELDIIKEQRNELKDDNNSLEQEYEMKLESLKAKNEELSDSKAIIEQKFVDYTRESESKLTELDEKMNKYTSENDYLKQELIKLRDIEDKFEKMRHEYQSRTQQDKALVDDNKKLKNVLNDTSKNIIKEIKALKPKIDTPGFLDKSVDELFQIFLQTILMKEKEIVRTMREHFDKEKQKLEDEKRQSVDSEKRTTLWAKELESEIEKLQADLSAREAIIDGLQKEIARMQQLLEESNRERDTLKEKINLLEADFSNVQAELKKYSKIDIENEEAIVIAQKREKQAQETIRSKEAEFQIKLKTEKEAYNKRIEDLACTIDSFKTKNMELTNSIEGLEANQKQMKNIIDLKTNELMKSNQIIQKMQSESEQLTEAYNELTQELEEKKLRTAEITEHLKIKCDELTEYKTNLETIIPENNLLKQQINERKASIEQYKIEIETLKMENMQELDRLKDRLNFEELKSVELNKQIADLNNKNVALLEEMNTLKNDHVALERKCTSLEKRVRNSTSKIQAEEQMEELKDLNRSLRNNLDGASNRITELQIAKTDLMKQLVTLNSQHDAVKKENQELMETLSSSKAKYDGDNSEKYDALLQEKNKIALELEATKFQFNQKNKELESCADKIKELTEKNTELDRESDELAEVIREHDAENTRLQDQLYTSRAELENLREKIEALEKRNPDVQIQSAQRTNPSSERVGKSYDECKCMILKNKIRELQLEIVSKNGKVATLELQLRSGSYPYQEKCKELQEHLLIHRNKVKYILKYILSLHFIVIFLSSIIILLIDSWI
jgi:chromosome segregation ATPase